MPANIGGAITPKNATSRSRPWATRYPCSHVTKTKTLSAIWIRPDTIFRPTRKSVKLATRKKTSPVAAEIPIQRRWLPMENTLLSFVRHHKDHGETRSQEGTTSQHSEAVGPYNTFRKSSQGHPHGEFANGSLLITPPLRRSSCLAAVSARLRFV